MSEELLCQCRGPNGVRCTKPFGHDGDSHEFEIELPPGVGELVAGYVDHLEQTQNDMTRHVRRLKRAKRAMYVAFVVNVVAATWNIVAILT